MSGSLPGPSKQPRSSSHSRTIRGTFLGKPFTGAVVVFRATKNASVPVLQVLDEAGYPPTPSNPSQKKIHLIIDVGHSSTILTLISLRLGFVIHISSSMHPIGGHIPDELLNTEFTKKTKLLVVLEHTKKNTRYLVLLSLKDGIAFTTTINPMRFVALRVCVSYGGSGRRYMGLMQR